MWCILIEFHCACKIENAPNGILGIFSESCMQIEVAILYIGGETIEHKFVNRSDHHIDNHWIVSYNLYLVDNVPYKSNVFFGAIFQ